MTTNLPYDSARLAALGDAQLSAAEKAIPPAADGMSVRDYLATGPRLSEFSTPLLTLDRSTLTDNTGHMAAWCSQVGARLEPHGKTTMAPALWAEQVDAGASGISVANFAQLRVGRAFGFRRLHLANEISDPRAIRWVADQQRADPDFSFVAWVDSIEGVDVIQRQLDSVGGTIDLVLDVGAEGGRAGVRTHEDAVAVARAVHAAGSLRLVGIGGYEGAIAHDPAGLGAVTQYLRGMRAVHEQLVDEQLYADGVTRMITAGGSAFFDAVLDVFKPCISRPRDNDPGTALVLRSGAYIVHDDGFYRGISPFSRDADATGPARPFRSAMHAWVRVLSRPEEGLALLDAGKRDVPYDEGLPLPQAIASDLGQPTTELHNAEITAVNDQHAFFRFDPATNDVHIGDIVKLGLSHPCTALQIWRYIPVLDDDPADPRVVDLVRTFF